MIDTSASYSDEVQKNGQIHGQTAILHTLPLSYLLSMNIISPTQCDHSLNKSDE